MISVCLSNGKDRALMNLLGCIYILRRSFSAPNGCDHDLILGSGIPSYYPPIEIIQLSNQCWGLNILELAWWSTPPTGIHYGSAILLIVNLSIIHHNQILNESTLSWNSFQCLTTPPPQLHPQMLPLILIYLDPNLPECYLFLTDLLVHL